MFAYLLILGNFVFAVFDEPAFRLYHAVLLLSTTFFIFLIVYVVEAIRSFSTALTVYHILYGLSSTFSTFFNLMKIIEKANGERGI